MGTLPAANSYIQPSSQAVTDRGIFRSAKPGPLQAATSTMKSPLDMKFLDDLSLSESPTPQSPVIFAVDATINYGPDTEEVCIGYKTEPRVYDSGKRLTVAYKRNKTDPDALENRLLDETREGVVTRMIRANNIYDTATRITVETIDGRLTWNVTEDLGRITSYLPIPPSLSHIPTAKITELEKISMVGMDVDRVKWQGQTRAFNKTGGNLNGTIQELTILVKLSASPCIGDLQAIVVDQDNKIRGFLIPFMRAGNLENVFGAARERVSLKNTDETTFSWTIKISWARQITEGVVELHAIGAYNGDLKPQSVLINDAGRAILIDFLPSGISEDLAAPELIKKYYEADTYELFLSALTASADVYSLGLLLCAVAEENSEGMRSPVWKPETPDWYRDIVEKCLVSDPELRPSALDLLSLLKEEGSRGQA